MFKLSDEEYFVKFHCFFQRKAGGSKYTGFGFVVKSLPSFKPSVSGAFSVIVDELDWFLNASSFSNLQEGGYDGTWAFEDRLLDSVSSLTIRVALYFKFQFK